MKILTPSGYREIADCQDGDEVAAFDMVTGAPLVNQIETIQWVDAVEWARWWGDQEPPPFKFYRINNRWTLNSEQSIWRNGSDVFHAKHLKVGDVIYDDADQPVTITSIEDVDQVGWWRFDISGDHSYIVDGLTLHNASRFWVGGTGTWDRTTTTHWASGSNGAGGQSAPGVNDAVTFDASSGGGTVTVTWDTGTVTVQSITCGAFTGTLDFAASDNNVTLSSTGGFNGSGTGTRTINLGDGTYTLTSTSSTPWNIGTTTNLTFNANASTILFSATTASTRTFSNGGLTYNIVSFGANTSGGQVSLLAALIAATLNIAAPNCVSLGGNVTLTNVPTWAGSCGSWIVALSSSGGTQRSLSVASGIMSASWCVFKDINFTGGATFNTYNSADGGNNIGITITPPEMTRSRGFSGFA